MFRLDAKLSKALGDAALAGSSMEPISPLTLETFLAAINQLFPKEVRPFVDDEEKFILMCEKSWPTREQEMAYAKSLASQPETNEPGTAVGFHIQLNPDFERILVEGSNSPLLESGKLMSVSDLMTIVCKDERASANLRERWQVNFKLPR